MIKIISTCVICLLAINIAFANINVMVIDSAFPPIKLDSFSIGHESCHLIDENNSNHPKTGDCYNKSEWEDVLKDDIDNLKGILDFYAKKETSFSKLWTKISKQYPEASKKVSNNFILNSHGTRSATLIYKHSNGKAKILPVRVLSTQAGTIQQTKVYKTDNKKLQKYSNECNLINWTQKQLNEFSNGTLQQYQQEISDLLSSNQEIKIINISLGYKRSWIKEDHPKCTTSQVDKEYKVLQQTWRNLINNFPKKIFFVAAGNESQNFNDQTFGQDDLWSTISDLENLILVGSTTKEGFNYPSSNFGDNVDVMALGENLEVNSPLPKNLSGYPTTIRGTSFSTPSVAGEALKIWIDNPTKTSQEIKKTISSQFFKNRQKVVIASYLKYCSNIKIDGTNCLYSIITILNNNFTWGNLTENFKSGKKNWSYAPFPIGFDDKLPTMAKTQLTLLNNKYLPAIELKTPFDPYELLITLNHEIYHYSQYHIAAKYFNKTNKINNCITDYQLALLNDEKGAFENEIKFWNDSPTWFKEKLSKISFFSKLLDQKTTYMNYYNILENKMKKDSAFIYKRYISLGEYPECTLKIK